MVNVNHIRKMSALSSQRWLITLSNALQTRGQQAAGAQHSPDSALVGRGSPLMAISRPLPRSAHPLVRIR